MHEATGMYSQTAFREGLKAEAFKHHDGVTYKCMTFLQDASKKIDKESGIWRLWDQPLAIPRASARLQKNVPKVKKELLPGRILPMEVVESQFERNKEDDDELKGAQRRGEAATRIAWNICVETKMSRQH